VGTFPAPADPYGDQIIITLGAEDAEPALAHVISRADVARVAAISLSRNQGTLQAEIAHTGALISTEIELKVYSTLGLRLRGGVVDQVVPVLNEERTLTPVLGAGATVMHVPWAGADEDAIALVSVRLTDAFGRRTTVERMVFVDSLRDTPAFDSIVLRPDPVLLGGALGVRRQLQVLGSRGEETIDLSPLMSQMQFSTANAAVVDVNARGQARAISPGDTTLTVELG
jgi:hypothetical protein